MKLRDDSTQQSCYWSGTSPFCAGGCDAGYSDCATDGCGNGACCVTGYKKYCCRGGCAARAKGTNFDLIPPPATCIHFLFKLTSSTCDMRTGGVAAIRKMLTVSDRSCRQIGGR